MFNVLNRWSRAPKAQCVRGVTFKILQFHMNAVFLLELTLIKPTRIPKMFIIIFFLLLFIYRAFVALAKYCNKNSNSINLMIMLTFFTTTAMQRLFALQTTIPGTAKVITYFILSLKPNLPEVSKANPIPLSLNIMFRTQSI